MISYLPAFALIFALSLIVSLAVTPLARRLGEHRDIADRPGGRRQHRGVIPRLGGIALYAGFTVAVLATILLPQRIFPPSLDPKEMTRLIGLLVGTTAVFIFGLLDDRYEFPSRPQYIAQFLSALIALAFIIFIERVNNPFSPRPDRLSVAGGRRADDLLVHGDDQYGQLARRAGWAGCGGLGDRRCVPGHPHDS